MRTRNEVRRENKLLGSLLNNVVAYEVGREAALERHCLALIAFCLTVLIGSGVIGPGVCLAIPVWWARVVLMALGLALLVVLVASIAVSVVAGLRMRGARALADWAPGGILDAFGSEADAASRALIESQREAMGERSASFAGAARLLAVADGLFMGALALVVIASVFAFVIALVA